MKLHERIRAQVTKAKLALQARNQERQTEASAEQTTLAQEMEILEKHVGLAVNLDAAEENLKNVLAHIDVTLASDPLPNVVANMRSYHWPTLESMTDLSAYEVLRNRKAELIAETKRQTVGLAQAALSEFESAHRDLLKRHGVL